MRNKKEYPENWSDEIRPAILKRDGYKCRICGMRHRSYIVMPPDGLFFYIDKDEVEEYKLNGHKAYQVFLQVAHLNHDRSNCNPLNLVTLCASHHHAHDMSWKLLKRKSNNVTKPTL